MANEQAAINLDDVIDEFGEINDEDLLADLMEDQDKKKKRKLSELQQEEEENEDNKRPKSAYQNTPAWMRQDKNYNSTPISFNNTPGSATSWSSFGAKPVTATPLANSTSNTTTNSEKKNEHKKATEKALLLLSNIPKNLNVKPNLKVFFSTYGKVLNALIKFNTNKAIIVFANKEDALVALKDKKPVFDKPFITKQIVNTSANKNNNAAARHSHGSNNKYNKTPATKQIRKNVSNRVWKREGAAEVVNALSIVDPRFANEIKKEKLKSKIAHKQLAIAKRDLQALGYSINGAKDSLKNLIEESKRLKEEELKRKEKEKEDRLNNKPIIIRKTKTISSLDKASLLGEITALNGRLKLAKAALNEATEAVETSKVNLEKAIAQQQDEILRLKQEANKKAEIEAKKLSEEEEIKNNTEANNDSEVKDDKIENGNEPLINENDVVKNIEQKVAE